MNEKELEMTEKPDDIVKENVTEVLPVIPEAEGAESDAVTDEADTVEAEPPSCEIGEDEAKKLTSHPMFVHFARGRNGSFDDICRDFQAMLSAEVISAKMTPSVAQASYDVALSERQRAIARAAGMTYREYYNILNGE